MLKYEQAKETSQRVSKLKEKLPNWWWKSQVLWNYIIVKLAPSPATAPFDSFPNGVSADSCPLNGPRQWNHLIHAQLVYSSFSPQIGVINKIYNLYHDVLG